MSKRVSPAQRLRAQILNGEVDHCAYVGVGGMNALVEQIHD